MKILSAELASSAAAADRVLGLQEPQIALVGRSNVGKSTLVNALTRRKLARTSRAPGKTDLINVYRVRLALTAARTRGVALVDLPGYGYARGGGSRAAAFAARAGNYIEGVAARGGRRGGRSVPVLLLVDARHPELEADRLAHAWLSDLGLRVITVATKGDILSRTERERTRHALEAWTGGPVLLVSARKGDGVKELWRTIVEVLGLN